MNLIVNGIEAMKDVDGMRELIIKSERAENAQILVSLSNTGIGFAPQLVEQIFDAFFTTKPNGTGMGLRISRSIIESHGGRLWAVGSPGRGATFHFNLAAAIPGCGNSINCRTGSEDAGADFVGGDARQWRRPDPGPYGTHKSGGCPPPDCLSAFPHPTAE